MLEGCRLRAGFHSLDSIVYTALMGHFQVFYHVLSDEDAIVDKPIPKVVEPEIKYRAVKDYWYLSLK